MIRPFYIFLPCIVCCVVVMIVFSWIVAELVDASVSVVVFWVFGWCICFGGVVRGFWLQYLFSDAVLRIWVLYPCFWYVLMISFMKVHIDTVPRMNVLPFFRFQDYVTSLIPIPITPGTPPHSNCNSQSNHPERRVFGRFGSPPILMVKHDLKK